jgi:hypothetical protein
MAVPVAVDEVLGAAARDLERTAISAGYPAVSTYRVTELIAFVSAIAWSRVAILSANRAILENFGAIRAGEARDDHPY